MSTTKSRRSRQSSPPPLDPFAAWVEESLSEVSDGADPAALHLLALRSAIRPGPDAALVARSLLAFLKAADAAGNAAVVSDYVADARQPGWARLAAALVVGDVEATSALSRHAAALAERSEFTFTSPPAQREAAQALSASRRFRLGASRVLVRGRTLLPSEAASVVSEALRSSWRDLLSELPHQVSWKGCDVSDVLALVSEVGPSLGLDTARRLLAVGLGSVGALEPSCRDRPRALDVLVAAFEHSSEVSVAGPSSLSDRSSLVLELLARPERGAANLAAALVRHHREVLSPPVLARLAASPSAASVLPEVLRSDSGQLAFDALEGVLAWAAPDSPLVVELVSLLRGDRNRSWWSRAEALRPLLGRTADLLAVVAAERLGPSFGYSDPGVSEFVSVLPDGVKEALVSLTFERVRAASAPAPKAWPFPSEDVLDDARAVLAESGYAPGGGLVSGSTGSLEKALRGLLLQESRFENHHRAGHDVTALVESWLHRLPAVTLATLAVDGGEYVRRCSAGPGLPGSVRRVLSVALEVAHTPSARAALLGALRSATSGSGLGSPLPWDQTLVQYAHSLRTASEHAS